MVVIYFDCYEADRRSIARFGIVAVILIRLHERFDKLRADQSHSMPKCQEPPRPIMRAAASLHSDQTGRQCCDQLAEFAPAHFTAVVELLRFYIPIVKL
jgi:hypothetical protein